jgi:uncharacterized protein YifN (PemK superfamily)
MALKMTASKNKRIDFEIGGANRTVEILEGKSAEDWNLCGVIPLSDTTERRKNDMTMKVQGELLSVTFRDSQAHETFERSIRRVQNRRAEIERAFGHLPSTIFTISTQNDDGTAPPQLPRLSFPNLGLDSIREIGDNDPIIHELL